MSEWSLDDLTLDDVPPPPVPPPGKGDCRRFHLLLLEMQRCGLFSSQELNIVEEQLHREMGESELGERHALLERAVGLGLLNAEDDVFKALVRAQVKLLQR